MIDDGHVEIIGFRAALVSYRVFYHFIEIDLGELQVGKANAVRLAQCEHVKICTDKTLPVQIDGGTYVPDRLTHPHYVIKSAASQSPPPPPQHTHRAL